MEFPDANELAPVVPDVELPRFARVRHEPSTPELDDPKSVARNEVGSLPLDGAEEGSTVAVGVGSRGIDRIDTVTAAVVTELADRGFDPVVVPAMGSHGGATSEGQRTVLESYGITEDALDCPIDPRTDTTILGETDRGFPVHWSTAALEADATLVINRVKAHTNFHGAVESGLTKMSVIGLGKQQGARNTHEHAIVDGYETVLRDAFDVIAAESNLVGGIALVENFHDRLAEVAGIPVGELPDGETPLLERAYEYMPTLPYDELDVLVVDRMGKDVSGAGMDTNVIGRYNVLNADDPEFPDIKRIYVRGLTEASHGNGAGIGLADVTRRSLVEGLDLAQTYTNIITSNSLAKAALPVVLPTDEAAVNVTLGSVGPYDPERVRVAWIRDTGHLSEFRISEALVDEAENVSVQDWERLDFEEGEATFEEIQ
ncbi:lactate racemase domain-containing protein [Haladaptatus sp. CMAA 1911]|uniref:lactate racemase domain-containing protein n=1 Tax=unclassified Haladaptatus TaxID=2622732 RepID=UPI00375519E6